MKGRCSISWMSPRSLYRSTRRSRSGRTLAWVECAHAESARRHPLKKNVALLIQELAAPAHRGSSRSSCQSRLLQAQKWSPTRKGHLIEDYNHSRYGEQQAAQRSNTCDACCSEQFGARAVPFPASPKLQEIPQDRDRGHPRADLDHPTGRAEAADHLPDADLAVYEKEQVLLE